MNAWIWSPSNERKAQRLGGTYPRRDECARLYHAFDAGSAKDDERLTISLLHSVIGIGLRCVRVILALLERAGVVERERQGFRRRRPFRDEREFTLYLEEHDRRHRQDEGRLSAMMKYGQSTECRMRFWTRYYAREITRDCGRCDNCRNATNELRVDVRELQEHSGADV